MAKKVAEQSRVYKNQQNIPSDVFKLEVEEMLKDHGWENNPMVMKHEHTHVFRTYDSSGKKLDRCSPCGGHFHMVEYDESTTPVTIKSVSVAMKEITVKEGLRYVKKCVPWENDSHTHEINYFKSDMIKPRKANVEFAKWEAEQRSKEVTSIPGVIAR